MTSKEASEKIMQFVNVAKEGNEEAYRSFSYAKKRIESKASSNQINLFGGTAVYEIREIVSETQEAAEEYYVSNQSLVRMLNDECKPLLAFSPYKKAVDAVARTIKKLNDDSSINTNFGASINYGESNDIASVHYEPNLESKMIQKFWEQKVLLTTESEEEKAEIKSEKAKKAKKEKAEQAERNKAHREYEEALKKHKEWEEECKKINSLIKKWTNEKVNEKRTELLIEASKILLDCPKIEENIKNYKLEKGKLEKELSELGFFAFGAKSEKKNRIKALEKSIISEENNLESIHGKYNDEKKNIEKQLSKYRKSLKPDGEEFVLPEEPDVPDEVFEPNPSYIGIDYSDREVLGETILDILLDVSKKMTTSQIMQYGSIDLPHSVISRAIRELVDKGYVEYIVENRRAYYKAK